MAALVDVLFDNIVLRSPMQEELSLRDSLDEYLERYLNLVNEYQLLQGNLAKLLSSVDGTHFLPSRTILMLMLNSRVISPSLKQTLQAQAVFVTGKTSTTIACKLSHDCTLEYSAKVWKTD